MTTVQQILDVLWSIAPKDFKESWDNVGLLCGRSDREVTKVLVALDPTVEVAQEAASLGCQLVVTHHPVIFKTTAVTDADLSGQRLLAYLEQSLSLICMHTNLDCAIGGVNDALANCLGLTQVQILQDSATAGLIRYGQTAEQTLAGFVSHVKTALGCEGLRYTDGGKTVRRVAVGGGSCSEFLSQVLALECDTFVTADVKYHSFCDAKALGLNLIDAGHFQTENPICTVLQEKLAAACPELTVIRSKFHKDAIQFA